MIHEGGMEKFNEFVEQSDLWGKKRRVKLTVKKCAKSFRPLLMERMINSVRGWLFSVAIETIIFTQHEYQLC